MAEVIAERVNQMFGSIAERYDLTNTVLSAGIDRWWRAVLVRRIPQRPNLRILDLCTGTGALLPLLQRRSSQVVGADFCWPMVRKGRVEFGRSPFLQADALTLPFRDGSFDVLTVAFGVRNLESLEVGLREMRRVLKPQGTLLVLEFGQPTGKLFGALFRFYSKCIMPLVGGIVTGNRDAYEYLPQTSARFPCREEFCQILRGAGFSQVQHRSLTGGIAYLYEATVA